MKENSKQEPILNNDTNDLPKKSRKTRWGQMDTSHSNTSGFQNDPSLLQMKTGIDQPPVSILKPSISAATPPVPLIANTQATSSLNFNVMAAATAAREALERVRKAALYQKQMHEQLTNLRANGIAVSPQTILSASSGTIQLPRPLKLDRFGREVDDQGKVIHTKPQLHSTLKINLNRMRDEKKPKEMINMSVTSTSPGQSKWFDSNLNIKKAKKKRGLSFLEPGTYIKQEQQLLRQQEAKKLGIDVKKLRVEKQQVMKRDAVRISTQEKEKREKGDTEIESDDESFNPNLIPLGQNQNIVQPTSSWDDEILTLEWWDLPFVEKNSNDPVLEDAMIVLDGINSYVEHPVIEALDSKNQKVQAVMMHLTQKERKKLRRRRRQEKERDKQNKILMGITPAPPPKVKLANLMRVLGDAAVSDPSKIEKEVQYQVKQRMKEHEDRNQERKLTPAQRSTKKELKWKQKDSERKALLFTIKDLSSKKAMFKIDINAKQLHLSGCCMVCPDIINVVIVEGGPRSIKFFKKLLTRRIQWDDPDISQKNLDDNDSENNYNSSTSTENCKLLWEGVAPIKSFTNWKLFPSKTEVEAKQIFKEAKAEHYWDRILSEIKRVV